MDYFAIGMSMIMKVAAIDGKKMTQQKLKVIKKKQKGIPESECFITTEGVK